MGAASKVLEGQGMMGFPPHRREAKKMCCVFFEEEKPYHILYILVKNYFLGMCTCDSHIARAMQFPHGRYAFFA